MKRTWLSLVAREMQIRTFLNGENQGLTVLHCPWLLSKPEFLALCWWGVKWHNYLEKKKKMEVSFQFKCSLSL